jgi:hypothetical protein
MKRSTVFTFCSIVAIVLFASRDNYAQTRTPVDAGSTKQEKVMEALLGEVHQLRLAVQHIGVNAYRGQVMVERLRLQHELVDRLTRELDSVRNEIGEIRAAQLTAKDKLDEAEKQQDKGLLSEASVSRVRAVVEETKRREPSLTERESRLSVELAMERANLADLNKRLDALEREMLMTTQIDPTKDSKKR